MNELLPKSRRKNLSPELRSVLTGAAVVFALSLILRLVHVLSMRHALFFSHPIQDEFTYDQFARAAAEQGDWAGKGAFYQAPLYQYFLAVIYKLFGHSYLTPRIIQAFIDSLSATGIFLIGACFFSLRVGWIAGVAAAFYSQFVFNSGTLLPPAITLFLDVALLGLLFSLSEAMQHRAWTGKNFISQSWSWIVPGMAFGLQALAATNILALAPIFCAWIFWGTETGKKKQNFPPAPAKNAKKNRNVPSAQHAGIPVLARIVAIGFFLCGIGITVLPATIHNYLVGKETILVSYNAGINFYIGNSGDYEKKMLSRVGNEWDAIKAVGEHAANYKEASRKFMEAAETYIAEHPVEYLCLLLHKTYLLFHGNEIFRNQAIYPDRRLSPVLRVLLWKTGVPGGPGIAFPWGVLLPLCIPGLFLAFKNRERKGIFLSVFWIAYGATIVAFFVTERYRIPLVPPMLIITADGWSRVHEWWKSTAARNGLFATMGAVFLIVNWNPGPMERETNHDAYLSVAEQFFGRGDTANAEICYRKGLALDPADANAWYLMAWHCFEVKGNLDSARVYYLRANTLLPGNKSILMGLARVAARQERYDEAERWVEQARAAIPNETGNTFENLGSVALQSNDFSTAFRYFTVALRSDPRSNQSLLGQAIAAFELKGWGGAIPYFEKLFSIYPQSADGYINLAIVYARSGNHRKAVDAAMKALSIDPSISAGSLLMQQAALCGRQQEVQAFLKR
jgi:tetratricopeptide (TPR) repeat protein